jgi:hypothetical protein
MTRDSIAAVAGGRGGRGGGRGGVSVADTSTLRWLQAQGVAAILLGDASHVGGDVGTNNGASRVSGVAAIPTVHVSQESYGRIARMVDKKVAVQLELNMQNRFVPENKASFNIIGEIPGTDPALKDEVVMIGAHFDSWHSGTGATDNGAGSGVMLEAMRLLKTLDLKPRRTIRIGLWTGEEQGLLGSAAYVKQHFGYRDSSSFHPTAEQAKFAAYFNVDNGSGKIRASHFRRVDGAVQGPGDEDADDQQHGRNRPPIVHRRRPSGIPVHPGSARLWQPHAPHQSGCVRAAPAGRHDVQLGGRREFRVAGRTARRETATPAAAGTARTGGGPRGGALAAGQLSSSPSFIANRT